MEMDRSGESIDEAERLSLLNSIADQVRRDGFRMVLDADSGHLGGSSSSVELMVSLYFGGQFQFDVDNSKNPCRDRVLVRGHLGPVRYPIFSLLGLIESTDLSTYRQLNSKLQGHEDMALVPGVDITPSGSLGMILSYGVGSAYAAKNKNEHFKTIVFLGDGEEQEGNVSEAARHAASLELDNLIVILDKNGKQLSRPTDSSDGSSDIKRIWQGYGWDVKEIENGHDFPEILKTYDELQNIVVPTLVIANTIKGKGLKGAEEHFSGYHTLSVCAKEIVRLAISELDVNCEPFCKPSRLSIDAKKLVKKPGLSTEKINYKLELDIKPSKNVPENLDYAQFWYFNSLREVLTQEQKDFYVLTPDFLREDYVMQARLRDYAYYVDTGIREQHTVAMAHGISTTNPDCRIFINYGDAFAFRALDQINAMAQGGTSAIIGGEYAGVSQAQNGKTHQSVGQPGALLSIPNLRFYEPADVRDLFNIFNKAFGENDGLSYIRLHPIDTMSLYRDSSDENNICSYITYEPDNTDIVVVASGFLVPNAVLSAKELSKDGIGVRVVNAINLNDLGEKFTSFIEKGKPVLTLYNGDPKLLPEKIGSTILQKGANLPSIIIPMGFSGDHSATITQLIQKHGLDVMGITKRIKEIIY